MQTKNQLDSKMLAKMRATFHIKWSFNLEEMCKCSTWRRNVLTWNKMRYQVKSGKVRLLQESILISSLPEHRPCSGILTYRHMLKTTQNVLLLPLSNLPFSSSKKKNKQKAQGTFQDLEKYTFECEHKEVWSYVYVSKSQLWVAAVKFFPVEQLSTGKCWLNAILTMQRECFKILDAKQTSWLTSWTSCQTTGNVVYLTSFWFGGYQKHQMYWEQKFWFQKPQTGVYFRYLCEKAISYTRAVVTGKCIIVFNRCKVTLAIHSKKIN